MPPRKKSTGRPVAVSEPSDDQEALPHSDAAQSSLAAPSVSGMQSSSISGTNGRVLEDMISLWFGSRPFLKKNIKISNESDHVTVAEPPS